MNINRIVTRAETVACFRPTNGLTYSEEKISFVDKYLKEKEDNAKDKHSGRELR